MSFTLKMKISGLCVLVPGDRRMHVLLPNTHGQGHHCHEHESRIYFDKRYLTGADQELTPPEKRESDELRNGSLLVGAEPASADVGITDRVLRIKGCRVHGECLTEHGGGRLDGRVTLLNGKIDGFAKGTCWTVPDVPGPAELTFQVLWSIPMSGDSLVWNVSPLHGGPAPVLRELKPVGTGTDRIIEVEIIHGMADEMPEKQGAKLPGKGDPPEHIAACLPIVFADFKMPDVRYDAEDGCCQLGYPKRGAKEGATTTTFSCMITAGDHP